MNATVAIRSERRFTRINASRTRELLTRPKLLLLDARDAKSFAAAHIPTAVLITRDNLDGLLLRSDKRTPVLVYCYHGRSSQTYAQMFADFGFAEVYSLDGGYEGWRQSGDRCIDNSCIDNGLRDWLTAHGFDTNANSRRAHGMTPLMLACRRGDEAAVQRLLQAGAHIQAKNADGNNALWHACLSNSLSIVATLVSAGIDIDNQNDYGATCLTCSCLRGKEALVAALLAAGANPHLKTREGFTAFDLATTTECAQRLSAAVRQISRPSP